MRTDRHLVKLWDQLRERFGPKPPTRSLSLDREDTPGIVRPPVMRCPKCKKSAHAWRRYADGRTECVACATKARR